VLEVLDFTIGQVLRVLENDDIFALELCAGDEILLTSTTTKTDVSAVHSTTRKVLVVYIHTVQFFGLMLSSSTAS
jgi:hypothetical protein